MFGDSFVLRPAVGRTGGLRQQCLSKACVNLKGHS